MLRGVQRFPGQHGLAPGRLDDHHAIDVGGARVGHHGAIGAPSIRQPPGGGHLAGAQLDGRALGDVRLGGGEGQLGKRQPGLGGSAGRRDLAAGGEAPALSDTEARFEGDGLLAVDPQVSGIDLDPSICIAMAGVTLWSVTATR